MKLSELTATVESLGGVGPATARQFAKLNIFTVADLLSIFPRDYEDRTKRTSLKDYAFSKVHTVCKVMSHQWFGFGKMRTLKIAVTDGTANAWLIAFNRPFLEKSLPQGSIISVCGKFEVKYNELQCTSFDAEQLAPDGELSQFENFTLPDSKIFPIYPLTEGLTQKVYKKAVSSALKLYAKTINNDLPENIISERKLISKSQAIIQIHNPENIQKLNEAKNSLIYEELYFFEYKMLLRALEHRGSLPDENIQPESFSEQEDFSPRQKQLLERLPFELTEDQKKVALQINADIDKSQKFLNNMMNLNLGESSDEIQNGYSMQRLLQGDVGSGKTLVSFLAALRIIDYGGQVALLAPTELLAKQHAENAAKLLESLGVRVAFLTGNLKSRGREILVNSLRDGTIDFVAGTHALFSQNVMYKKLQLAIIDEQHKFGVTQRESIIAKGRKTFNSVSHSPDLLMMSATPIPQTLALTAFGDLDVSTIKSMPKGRLPVKTYLTVFGNERNVYEAVRKELAAGHQAYFVYPRIGDAETDDKNLKSAEEMFKFLSQQVYPEYKCALVHGRIDDDEQHKILEEFKNGSIKILVATTVVEVGVDVANATCIVIEHANRFALSELHQLRGRVGRNSLQSYCFLTYDKNITEAGIARLKALHETTDGFKIAEEDLKLRGPGELSGTAQSGYLTLAIADFARDAQLLKEARLDAYNQIKLHNL
ncbi:MAG: ATP-dependent DNA helicase RecG [Treponema sp.]|nr:ATP-dependent DNA helicase RecG [Treponema sp.]